MRSSYFQLSQIETDGLAGGEKREGGRSARTRHSGKKGRVWDSGKKSRQKAIEEEEKKQVKCL